MFGKKYRTNEINQTYPTTFAFDRNVQCLNLDPVGTDTFFWIRNNFFLIRIQAKMKNRYMVNILLSPPFIVQQIHWNIPYSNNGGCFFLFD